MVKLNQLNYPIFNEIIHINIKIDNFVQRIFKFYDLPNETSNQIFKMLDDKINMVIEAYTKLNKISKPSYYQNYEFLILKYCRLFNNHSFNIYYKTVIKSNIQNVIKYFQLCNEKKQICNDIKIRYFDYIRFNYKRIISLNSSYNINSKSHSIKRLYRFQTQVFIHYIHYNPMKYKHIEKGKYNVISLNNNYHFIVKFINKYFNVITSNVVNDIKFHYILVLPVSSI